MGIMPVAVYSGTDAGGVDPFSGAVPQEGVLTHGHLAENDNHGGTGPRLPDARRLPSAPWPFDGRPIGIDGYAYQQGDLHGVGRPINPPTIQPGDRLRFISRDAGYEENAFHTITSCKAPCNRTTGIAYPLANGPVSFDSGQLGFNYEPFFDQPAADRASWKTPRNLDPGTYNYFCRIHPFMRGAFRVAEPKLGTEIQKR
jgi:plastocyanin